MNAPVQTPIYAISSRASVWHAFDWWESARDEVGPIGLDLDLTSWMRRRWLGIRSADAALAQSQVVSIWVHPRQIGPLLRPDIASVLHGEDICLSERTVVIQHDALNDTKGDIDAAIAVAARLRASAGPSMRVALALRPINPDGGRDHLRRLQALRHRAAEWEVEFALDLTGRLDETWEAEAAVLRMGKRLAVVRFEYPHAGPVGSPKWRLIRRILSATTDSDFGGIIAIAPRADPWRLNRRQVAVQSVGQAIADLRLDFRRRAELSEERNPRPGRPT